METINELIGFRSEVTISQDTLTSWAAHNWGVYPVASSDSLLYSRNEYSQSYRE